MEPVNADLTLPCPLNYCLAGREASDADSVILLDFGIPTSVQLVMKLASADPNIPLPSDLCLTGDGAGDAEFR
jgi:hypothetical protein